jgi:aminoglycoside phosphotransferase (APT) family kinase protein
MSAAVDPSWLAGVVGGGEVTGLRRLLGGASQQIWAFELDGRPLVLRRAASSTLHAGRMQREAAVLRRVRDHGVRVPEMVASGPDFVVMSWVEGETLARRILRDDRFVRARTRLVAQCAQQLAILHNLAPEDFPELTRTDPLAEMRATVDDVGEPHPALELGFLWLQTHRPAPRADAVVHGDFRLGNLMVDDDGLAAVLDWELCYIGDPLADLGWLCVKSWRFGARPPVAGLGSRQELLTAYEQAGGRPVSLTELRWWEVFGTLRWAVLCMLQARTHLEHGVRSVELASIGRRVCEVELDLLDLIAPSPDDLVIADAPDASARCDVVRLHDRPTAAELVVAVREFLEGVEVAGHDRFLMRVSARALSIVERELELGPALEREHAARLEHLGMRSDDEFADAIRNGRIEANRAYAEARAAVVAKLHVADPRQLIDRSPPDVEEPKPADAIRSTHDRGRHTSHPAHRAAERRSQELGQMGS